MIKLLLTTSSLVVKINGKFDFPKDKHSKTVIIKKLIKIMELESAQIEYLGYDYEKSYTVLPTIEDSLIIAIHVIEDPHLIDYSESSQEQVSHFLKHIKKNTSRILLQEIRTNENKTEHFFEFYVRAKQDLSRTNRNLKQA